ncbi:hypothetical protein E2H12_24360 [Salmonella enterica subsp. enterica]|nr:hypothetical protein [Salmonella enterica subsp. enterica]
MEKELPHLCGRSEESLLSSIVIAWTERRIWLSPFSLRLTTGLYRVNTCPEKKKVKNFYLYCDNITSLC